jgi:proteasome lid subunit RPN8/RPN11
MMNQQKKIQEKLEIEVIHFMLKDIGSSAYTEYEFGEEMIDVFEEMPELMQAKMGHLHTHHNMDAYFSGTDMHALHEGANSLDMFLSIIVNRKGKKIAKIAMITEMEKKMLFKHQKKQFFFISNSNETLGILDCDVVIENEERYKDEILPIVLKKKKEKEKEEKRKTLISKTAWNGKQLSAFETDNFKKEVSERVTNVDNEELLTELAIRNLIIRSLAYDDLVEGKLEESIKIIDEMMESSNSSFEVNRMVEHYLITLENEYYYDQFEYVTERVLSILYQYRYDYKFINEFCFDIEKWFEVCMKSGNVFMDIGRYVDSYRKKLESPDRKTFANQKNIEDEF